MQIPLCIGAAAACLFVVAAGVAEAQSAPAPAPTAVATATPAKAAKKSGLIFSGSARVYDFDRLNQTQNSSNPNRTAFNVGGLLKLDYVLPDSPLSIGAGYYGAYPFGVNGVNPQLNSKIDNSLPGYSLSTLGQLYLKYDTKPIKFALGNLLYSSPWLPPSDSRIKPALYRGADLSIALDSHFTVGASRLIAFENRIQSDFERETLLSTTPTSGALLGSLGYHNRDQFATLTYNDLYDYANLTYLEAGASLDPLSRYKPTIAFQYVTERQSGKALSGIINNETYGLKLGMQYTKNISLGLGYDQAPWQYTTVVADSPTAAEKGIFIPGGGTGAVQSLGGNVYRVAYGGIASPYTDSYATDPLYTTSISQGAVDRRSAGDSLKASITYTTDNKRLIGIVSGALYDYGNDIAINNTYETDVDATYRFAPVKAGPYHGLSLRERYAVRSQDTLPFKFQYVRTQLQYDW